MRILLIVFPRQQFGYTECHILLPRTVDVGKYRRELENESG